MIDIYKSDSRYQADHGWLNSRFSFSFADYYDPNNVGFGVLRVLNDDIVDPGKGFGLHPHRDMEIVSIVLEGQLQHTDSTGHSATTSFGGIQRMTAGTGIMHSEMNPSQAEAVNFLQLWFMPEEKGLAPSYEQTSYSIDSLKNQLLPVVSKHLKSEHIANIHQDLTLYLSDIEAGNEVDFLQAEGRRLFIFVIEGDLSINDTEVLNKRDSARITEMSRIKIHSSSGSRFMLIDLP